jgi:hypothetical protein
LIWQKFVDITERVDFITKSVVGRDLDGLRLSGFRVLDSSYIEELVVLLSVELVSELIDTCDSEDSTKCFNCTLGLNLIAGQVVITDEVLARLIHCKALRKLLSLQE